MSNAVDHTPGDRFQFGPFELRATERLLLHKGAPLDLGGRAMDLLVALVERRGETVSAEALHDRVWRGINVDPTALRMQVRALRKALAAADPATDYIANVAGQGYRFAAPISDDAASGPAAVDPPNGLPAALHRMIGRERAVTELHEMILKERLVSVVGAGGLGKTTVAIATAHQVSSAFAGDVVLVDLTIEQDNANVAAGVAAALNLTRLGDDPIASIVSQLASRRLLLILDSCEHVLAGAARLADALQRDAPHVHILATSREPLNLRGEQVHRLAGLDAPPLSETISFEELWSYPSVQLFVDRVSASGSRVEPRLDEAQLVAEICRKLDGIPLAIELAAGRVAAYGLATTLSLLDSRLLLAWPGRRTAPSRQATLSATLGWSYNLLSVEEARLLRALSAFVGGFTLADIKAVAVGVDPSGVEDVLASLVSKSLVAAEGRRSTLPYRLLDATRDYARLKLEDAGELRAVAARHADWATDGLRRSEAELEVRPMIELLDSFHGRLREAEMALDWSVAEGGDPSIAPSLTLAAAPMWLHFARAAEARRRIETAMTLAEPDSREEIALNLTLMLTLLEITPQEPLRMRAAGARALELAEMFNDRSSQLNARWGIWNTYVAQAPDVRLARADARGYSELAATHGQPLEIMIGQQMVAISELLGGDLATARAAIDRAVGLQPNSGMLAMIEAGFDPGAVAKIILTSVLWLDGMTDSAEAVAQNALTETTAHADPTAQAMVLVQACGALAICVGDLAAADRYADQLAVCADQGVARMYAVAGTLLRATVAARRGHLDAGRAFVTPELAPECGHPMFTPLLVELAQSLAVPGGEDVARDFADRLLRRIEATGEHWMWGEVQRVRGELAEDPATAVSLFEAALGAARRQGARTLALRAATSLARRRPSTASEVLKPLLTSLTEGAETRDHRGARAVLETLGLS